MTIGEIDQKYSNKIIIGVDDVGRGCIAGNLYLGFVSLNILSEYPNIDDSKKLSKIFKNDEKRFILDKFIKDNSKYLIMQVSVEQINTGRNLNNLVNIQIINGLNIFCNKYNIDKKNLIVFMDGFDFCKDTVYNIIFKPKFDLLSVNVAAASIIAKNVQVSAMKEMHNRFPQYHFNEHNGYATKKHKESIKECGLSPYHRVNWCK